MNIVIGVDPGKTCGVCVAQEMPEGHVNFNPYQVPFDTFGWNLEAILNHFTATHADSGVTVACERFVISSGTVRKAADASYPLEAIGVARFVTLKASANFRLQSAGDAKRFAPDAHLRAAGWWLPGNDHANDATRHAVLAFAEVHGVVPVWI